MLAGASSVPMHPVPIYKALMEREELDAASEALRRGWLGMGEYVDDFEQAIEKAVGGSRRAVAVSTGYAALHLGMIIAGIGPGDEVIVPSLTHLADVQAIRAVGAEPVLCDVDDATLCLDPARAAELIGPRTRAIVTMDYGCHLADHGAFSALAADHGLRVIHDAAHSFGASVDDQAMGGFSDICMLSFDPVKALSCIDAGVVMVKTQEDVLRLRELRVLGASHAAELAYGHQRAWSYDVAEDGFRYHLSNVHAAIGLAQLAKLDRIRCSRQAGCRTYRERLDAVDGVTVPGGEVDDLNPFLYYVRVDADCREAFREHLAGRGIETGIHWVPVHRLTLFRGCRAGDLSVTDRAADEIVSLPLHSAMPVALVHQVCDAVESFFQPAPAIVGSNGHRPSSADQRRYSA
ncbi:MAG TPA: DegT/DnrJ/EryC1/StrS family aminotransferase [Acidimicrobiales bacterium]|nr:DegT/DnrJ/EryC1/StrS family aminotransferase [Acidimicrobiales bacterium]